MSRKDILRISWIADGVQRYLTSETNFADIDGFIILKNVIVA